MKDFELVFFLEKEEDILDMIRVFNEKTEDCFSIFMTAGCALHGHKMDYHLRVFDYHEVVSETHFDLGSYVLWRGHSHPTSLITFSPQEKEFWENVSSHNCVFVHNGSKSEVVAGGKRFPIQPRYNCDEYLFYSLCGDRVPYGSFHCKKIFCNDLGSFSMELLDGEVDFRLKL